MESRTLSVGTELVARNLHRGEFLSTRSFPGTGTVFLGLGRRLIREGVAFETGAPIVIRSRPTAFQRGPQAYTKKRLFAQYAHYYLAKGQSEAQAGNWEAAATAWKAALAIVPYAAPAYENLCRIGAPCDQNELEALKSLRLFY
jgi:hypothetical protein